MVEAQNDNERVVLDFFATLSTGDLEAVRARLHPDASWVPQVQAVPGAGVHRGRDKIIDEFLAPVRGLFKPGDPKVHVDTIASRGSLVLCETRGVGTLADGRPYNNLYAWGIEVKDGKVFVLREYMDSHYVMTLFPNP
jgi:ketosteroid isomerase-like protein